MNQTMHGLYIHKNKKYNFDWNQLTFYIAYGHQYESENVIFEVKSMDYSRGYFS